jgi:hypothetical protein
VCTYVKYIFICYVFDDFLFEQVAQTVHIIQKECSEKLADRPICIAQSDGNWFLAQGLMRKMHPDEAYRHYLEYLEKTRLTVEPLGKTAFKQVTRFE